ncbi:MAG: BREX system P-loop protein BrxC, partial [bacterium]
MKIEKLFKKEIHRNINGVIKVGQQDQENIFQELDEYVITKELDRHFHDFYHAFAGTLNTPTDKMGVWISGFFGSGKSHFLKILSYLLANREAKDKKALDFFKPKVGDPMLFGEMERCTAAGCDVILFNIDSKSDADASNNKDAIVRVFMKVFDEFQGFCGDMAWVAALERQLDKDGNYNIFKSEIHNITGKDWVELRSNFYFERDNIMEALVNSTKISRKSAEEWFENGEKNYSLN